MKELSFEKMEQMKGGAGECFFAIPMLFAWSATGNGANIYGAMITVAGCWNS